MEDFGCGLACPPMDEVGILGIDLQIHFDLSPEKFFECVQEVNEPPRPLPSRPAQPQPKPQRIYGKGKEMKILKSVYGVDTVTDNKKDTKNSTSRFDQSLDDLRFRWVHDEAYLETKLKESGRKIHARNQEEEKNQRKIQIIDIVDLPKETKKKLGVSKQKLHRLATSRAAGQPNSLKMNRRRRMEEGAWIWSSFLFSFITWTWS
ncbi:uncharacterized protein LOC110625865 [Manihot esculenta]|uniref:Uncharacterized protein n=1 Tax=Manihot esculenta TaxID=3983 RepID=A0ACB7GSD4_MANES|nr:uncharacterized protein LOC110625865 [Manihot esculenta]KAG8643135.1 hypothetical protein MANES_11G007450v8 [Manihot esculenta]